MRWNHRNKRAFAVTPLLAAALGCIATGIAAGQTYTVLNSFALPEGTKPIAGLLHGSDGYLYGTTEWGGASGIGTVFRIDTSGNRTTLHSFDGTDGARPMSSLIEAADGFFYGTTFTGGAGSKGTVFRIDTAGNLTTLYSFQFSADGSRPLGRLVEGTDGLLYGTTSQGGSSQNCGTVFRVDTAGNLTTLHAFDYTDGCVSGAGLIQAADSYYYGTTEGDYWEGFYGNVFRIDASGNLTVLHEFAYTEDGAVPEAPLLEGSDGYLYGTTSMGGTGGGGTVFRIDTGGNLTTLHSFGGGDGSSPAAGLIQASNGYFYGTTSAGGTAASGTIFRIDATGNFWRRHSFSVAGGADPQAGLIQPDGGLLYGTTRNGGSSGVGVVFQLEDCVIDPPPVITPGGPTSFCVGGSVVLDAGPGYASYLWSPGGATTQTILVDASGSYSVAVTDDAGCAESSAPMAVTEVPYPSPVITAASCLPANAPGRRASVPYVSGHNWLWTIAGGTIESGGGTNAISYTSGDPGTSVALSVVETTPEGCQGTAADTIPVEPAPVLSVSLCLAPNTPGLTASVTPADGATYAWTITGGTIDSGQGTPSISFTSGAPGTPMTLSVQETSGISCQGTAAETMQADFGDVPPADPFYAFVCAIARHGITAGYPNGDYGVDDHVTRAQMAVFLLKAEHGADYAPPACTGIFADVACAPTPAFAAGWIERLYEEGITAGCSAGEVLRYCPDQPVPRAQMAVFLLRTKHGPFYAPPGCAGIFADVPCTPVPAFAVDWIEELYNEGIAAGCQSSPPQFCPGADAKRGQMSAFLVRTFGLE